MRCQMLQRSGPHPLRGITYNSEEHLWSIVFCHCAAMVPPATSYGALQASADYNLSDDDSKNFSEDVNVFLQDDLLGKGVFLETQRKRKFPKSIISVITLTILLTGLVLMVNLFKPSHYSSEQTSQLQSSDVYSSSASFLKVSSVSNKYGVWDPTEMLSYPFLLDALLLEPYKETAIVLATPISGCTYNWYFTDVNNDTISSRGISTNGTIVTTLYSAGEYILTASENCTYISDSERQLTKSVWVKYVRRELSTLQTSDREDFLDAFYTLWTVSTTAGKVLYGDRYKSINYFATLHNDGGGNDVCDEFHGGYGFLNNHMYLSAYLEQSLQLVNPSVALHYMEYGKYFESDQFQTHFTNQMDGGAWTSILSEKFFGTSDPYTGRIINSRWANLKIPYMTPSFYEEEGIDPDHTFYPDEEKEWLSVKPAHTSSPYGLLRSPWNYNQSPYLARYNNVYRINDSTVIGENVGVIFKFHMGVNCSTYRSYFAYIDAKPLQTSLINMENDIHGIFHFTFGGVGGDHAVLTANNLKDNHGFTSSNLIALSGSAQHFFKKHFASGLGYPLNCTASPWQYTDENFIFSTASAGIIGGPQCDFDSSYYESQLTVTALVKYFFNFDTDTTDSVIARVGGMELSEQIVVMKLIANMFPFDGDLASSGAALDPLFWVAHGAMERTFQKTVVENMMSDMNYVKTGHCSGHSATSTKAWLDGFYFSNESVISTALTNAELTAILDPTSDKYRDLVNFVYDTGSYSWCPEANYWFQ